MPTELTDRAQQTLALAEQESQRYRHSFVGTEHILLALVADSASEVASILKTFCVNSRQIRQQVESLIAPGTSDPPIGQLPLTPRANQVLAIASEEARNAAQESVEPGHLLLGLLREPTGVAGIVLKNLEVNLRIVREAVLRIRHAQMKLVERAVRPVTSSVPRKRKMREELLAHLTSIYEEECSRTGNPVLALRAAEARFGDPAALAAEFNLSLPLSERLGRYVNPNLTQRPSESAFRYMLRFAAGITTFVALFHFILLLLITLKDGWNTSAVLAKPLVAALPFFFLDSFVLGLLYIRLRDAMWGAPWARKSTCLASTFLTLIALVAFGSALAFNVLANVDQAHAARSLFLTLGIAAVASAVFPIVARVNGQEQISDAVWASLDLESAPTALD